MYLHVYRRLSVYWWPQAFHILCATPGILWPGDFLEDYTSPLKVLEQALQNLEGGGGKYYNIMKDVFSQGKKKSHRNIPLNRSVRGQRPPLVVSTNCRHSQQQQSILFLKSNPSTASRCMWWIWMACYEREKVRSVLVGGRRDGPRQQNTGWKPH